MVDKHISPYNLRPIDVVFKKWSKRLIKHLFTAEDVAEETVSEDIWLVE